MKRLFTRTSKRVGLEPGTPVLTGEKRTGEVNISITTFSETRFEEKSPASVEECRSCADKKTITWININGIHNPQFIEQVGLHFNIHPLVLEDIVNIEQRPKLEDFGDYLFIILKMLYMDNVSRDIMFEQVSIILGPNYVISFQEKEGDVFNPIREKLRKSKGRIRKGGADYLAYALMDAIIDQYFVLLEKAGDRIEALEEEMVSEPTQEHMRELHRLKNDVILLRRSVWPLREVVSTLERGGSPLVKKATGPFIRDLYDHSILVIESIDTYRDLLSGMLDLYLSTMSNRMNEVMKVLTVIATIFIPLTFIAGIYGMNFREMPELEWYWGYFAVLAVMVVVGVSMLLYFRRRKWV